jgi:hypothetical protein
MSCRHCSILIVESRISPGVVRLQALLEQKGAETLVARDAETALERCRQFAFTAALVNAEHRELAPRLEVPVLVYLDSQAPETTVEGLERLLAERASLPERKM